MSRSNPHPIDGTQKIDGLRLSYYVDGSALMVELVSPEGRIQDVTLTIAQARAVQAHIVRWLRHESDLARRKAAAARRPTKTKTLSWSNEGTRANPLWRSTCGRYCVWIQSRPRDDGAYWGAEAIGQAVPHGKHDRESWITQYASSRAEAMALCEEHAQKSAK